MATKKPATKTSARKPTPPAAKKAPASTRTADVPDKPGTPFSQL